MGVDVQEITNKYSTNIFGRSYENIPNKTIKTVHLPKNLKTIGNNVFSDCTALTVTIKQTNLAKIKVDSNAFDDVKQIRVPQGSLQAYKTMPHWENWKNKIVGY